MWFHGTNQNISKFEVNEDIQGLNTNSYFTSGLIYFTNSPELAFDYANSAAKNMYPDNHGEHEKKLLELSNEYNSLLDNGLFDKSEELMSEIEDYSHLISTCNTGQQIYPVHLVSKKVKQVDYKGFDWGGDNADKLIELAINKNLDVLIVNNVIDKTLMNKSYEPISIAIVLNPDVIHTIFSGEDLSANAIRIKELEVENTLTP